MAKLTKWTCDGCDESKDTDTPSEPPVGWADVTLEVTFPAGSTLGVYALLNLCRYCQHQIVQNADPRQWPRCKAIPATAA